MASIVDIFEALILLILLWFIVPSLLGATFGSMLASGNWLVYILYIIFFLTPLVYFWWIWTRGKSGEPQ